MPKTITCDFEVALLKSIHEEFSGEDVDITCCEFHWKQALRRKLIQFGLPTKQVSKMIEDGGTMKLLTIIPIDGILSKGVPYVRSITHESPYQNMYDTFWNYFIKTWIVDYDPKFWNVN